jgi:hypothetical protein
MHQTTFLSDLAIVMIVAGRVTVLFHRLKQPVVQRDEASLINPGPDEKLPADNDVLLLGCQGHLDSAQKLFNDDPHT